ncbi:hypothetical protein ILUMI_01099 [Ignelater luminosus]|uniref:Uncharacterized protein n=1 Tax=Ignelater luminosus TaxID=2038154 RepID=A0A8K0GMJ1_IGNLU|nr:hypothetical protein ILUMI_01099 [Ignelater luminosus]
MNIIKFLFVLFSSVCLNVAFGQQINFKVIRQWKYINYSWPTSESYQTAITTSSYIPENIVIAGVTIFDNWFYLTMPRMKPGVPATLGRIPVNDVNDTAPLVSPFPTWEFNKLNDCGVLQNVQNTEIDPKGEIWIIDGGHSNSLTPTPIKNCPAKLVIFDIKSNRVVATHIFPEEVASRSANFLYDLVVDSEREFAYITDNSRDDPGIIVFSRTENQSWKIRHSRTMKADSSAQKFEVNDVPISSPINVAGIALSPKSNNNDREVFYCPLSSLHLYSISASVLRNRSNSNKDYSGIVKDIGVKASQSDGMIMSNQGVLYYGLLSDNSIARWDSHTSFSTNQTILSRDFEYIQWTNSFTIDLEGNLIVLTNTLQKFVHQQLHVNLTNFWLISAYIGEKSYLYDNATQINTSVNQSDLIVHENDIDSSKINQNVSNRIDSNVIVNNNTISVNDTNTSGTNYKIYNVFVVILLTVLCFSI